MNASINEENLKNNNMENRTSFQIISPEPVDPFSAPLKEDEKTEYDLSDDALEANRAPVSVGGMKFSFMKPPYMNFDDQVRTKLKLKEAFAQKEFLLVYGYSGVGKTTVLTQFAQAYPDRVFYIDDFDSLTPSTLLIRMGQCVNLELRQRRSEIFRLEDHLKAISNVMFLFDQANAGYGTSIQKLEYLRKINDATRTPIVISGIPKLYKTLYDPKHLDDTCSVITRLDELEMKGMRREDAANYLAMVAKKENLIFHYPAQQALISYARYTELGGISFFTTIIGRSITMARGLYYHAKGRSIPEYARCVRPAEQDGKQKPGDELILPLPVTPEPVTITETIVNQVASDFKSNLPKLLKGRSVKE